MPQIRFLPYNLSIEVSEETTIQQAEMLLGIPFESPCGGCGKCGKCEVEANGKKVLACCTYVTSDMTVTVKDAYLSNLKILSDGIDISAQVNPVQKSRYLAAVDIGTTSVVVYVIDGNSGEILSRVSALNPQHIYGADVISRIRYCLQGLVDKLTLLIRNCISDLITNACKMAEISAADIGVISFVGNPCMQQIFLGMSVKNLSEPPFSKVLNHIETKNASEYLDVCPAASLLVVPDIAGYIGSDTVACILSSQMHKKQELSLIVDIGTNGEMVLGNRERMIACSTAAGPALEGASITCGMRGTEGAIDHIWMEDGIIHFTTIDNARERGICGSGLIDAIAVLLENGQLDKRGRIIENYEILHDERIVRISENIYLTQNDIREIQMAKGAIAAGIYALCEQFNIDVSSIKQVYLAGAFGTYINSDNACRIGMIPDILSDRIQAVGNAAGSGCILTALNKQEFFTTNEIVQNVEALELSVLPSFKRLFARNMNLPI